jgi:hypothetical protein
MTDDHQRRGKHISPELKIRHKADSSLEDGPDFLNLYGSFFGLPEELQNF